MSSSRLVRQTENKPGVVINHPYPSTSPNTAPYIAPELLMYLRSKFAPSVSHYYDLRNYDRQVGWQEVMDHLQHIHDTQGAP